MFAYDVQNLGESLELLMTLAVERTIYLYLLKTLLLFILQNGFKFLEYDFGSDQLAVLFIMFLHLRSIITYLSHALIIPRCQVIQLLHQVIPLIQQLVNYPLQIGLLLMTAELLSLSAFNCIIQLFYLLLSVEYFLFQVGHLVQPLL